MLGCGASERHQCVILGVVAFSNRNGLDRRSHILVRDLQQSGGQLFTRAIEAVLLQLSPQFIDSIFGCGCMKGKRKLFDADSSKQKIQIRHGERTSAAVARWSRIGSSALGPNNQFRAVETTD